PAHEDVDVVGGLQLGTPRDGTHLSLAAQPAGRVTQRMSGRAPAGLRTRHAFQLPLTPCELAGLFLLVPIRPRPLRGRRYACGLPVARWSEGRTRFASFPTVLVERTVVGDGTISMVMP